MSHNKKETLYKFYPRRNPDNERSFLSYNFPQSIDLLSEDETKPVSMRSHAISHQVTLRDETEPDHKSNTIGLQTKRKIQQARIETWAQSHKLAANPEPLVKNMLKKRSINDYYQRKNSQNSDDLFHKPLAVVTKKPKKNTLDYYYRTESVKSKAKVNVFPKFILIRIMQYLRIRESVILSSVSKQFSIGHKYLFIFSDYFANLNTENFDENELKFIIKKRKSAQMSVLNQMLRGKSLKTYLAKNSISWEAGNASKNHSEFIKFGVFPKKSKQVNTLITDANFEEVFESSRLSLQDLRLVNSYLLTQKSFSLIPRIKNLQCLHITYSSALQDSIVLDIVIGCKSLTEINFSKCSELSSSSLMYILNNCWWLEHLDLSNNPKMFVDKDYFDFFSRPIALKTLNIEGCGLSIEDIVTIAKYCKSLEDLIIDRRLIASGEVLREINSLKRYNLKVTSS